MMLDESTSIIEQAIKQHSPVAAVSLFSGGHDSYCATHIHQTMNANSSSVAHINTGIGIEETRSFVRERCKAHQWKLHELHPAPYIPLPKNRVDGIDYENLPCYDSMAMHYGFPGPSKHHWMYARLKERPLIKMVKSLMAANGGRPRKDCVMLIGGMRKEESRRRMGYGVSIQRLGRFLWVSPCINWKKQDQEKYMQDNSLPSNPVKLAICISGECLCGAYASKSERVEIKHAFPETHKRISLLEEQVAKLRCTRTQWGWCNDPTMQPTRAKNQKACGSCKTRN